MNRKLLFLVVVLFILAMDLYSYRGIRNMISMQSRSVMIFSIAYWALSLLVLSAVVWTGSAFRQLRDPAVFYRVSLVLGIFLMLYVPKILFNLFQAGGDLAGGIAWVVNREAGPDPLRKFFLVPGSIAGILLMAAFAMGMIRGKTNLKVFREEIPVAHLPEPFSGIRIAQISDFHLAGFYHQPGYIRTVVDRVNRLEPDLILFTGDMVHNFAEEMDPFMGMLKELKAPLGQYAILGNHDYGHYFDWDSEQAKEENLERVKAQIREAGFDLLLNEHRTLTVDGEAIELIGVENWGKPPMPQKGDLGKALEGTDRSAVKILLSHDPAHWELHVKDREDIPLTLAGHTHGFQFGFEIGKFRWSPSKWMYDHWAGLYGDNGQYIYVNRGAGFTGFPGRVGIPPEITLITLVRARSSLISPEAV